MKSQIEEMYGLRQLEQRKIICSEGKQSIFCCESPNCEKYAFTCIDDSCKCQKDHLKCIALGTKELVNNIYSKVNGTKQLQNHIDQMIQISIDELSKLKEDLINRINKEFKYIGLSNEEYFLINAIEQNNLKSITGKHIWKTIHELFNESTVNEQMENFQKTMDQIWKQEQSLISKLKQSMLNEIAKMQTPTKIMVNIPNENNILQIRKLQRSINKYDKINFLIFQYKNLFKESKIVLNNQGIQNLERFFGDKKVKSTKMLYRASQNNFLASKFHEKCANVPHTLTLVETQFGKIIGGYTPIIWNQDDEEYETDPQRRSFIFSLTNNQKLTINPYQNQQYQIYCDTDYGPVFGGGHDLYIDDRANQVNGSHAKIGHTYVHSNYSYNNQQSYKKFSGALWSQNFKIKQWQVYSLQIQDNN